MTATRTGSDPQSATTGRSETDGLRLWSFDEEFPTLAEITQQAERLLDRSAWAFLEGGAGDERTLRWNEASFKQWQFLPKALTGAGRPDTLTTILGMATAAPLFVSPFGFDRLFHPDGQPGVLRACATFNLACIVPEMCSFSLEEVAAAAPDAPRLFQLSPIGDEDHLGGFIERAHVAGYRGICFTVDAATPGWRERSMRDAFTPAPELLLGNYREPNGASPAVLMRFLDADAPRWTWTRLGGLMAGSPMPWLVKGVLTAADAVAAVEAGASGVMVSNHGGRQLDGAPAALDQLPAIRRAVGDELPVLVDGGVRRGSDIATAIALGATAAGIGRVAARGLAAGGEGGVRRALELLLAELTTTLTLIGVSSVHELSSHHLRRNGDLG